MMYTSHGIKYIVLIIKQIVIFIVSTQKKNNDFLKVNKTKHLHTHVSHAYIKNWRGCKSLQNFEILVM